MILSSAHLQETPLYSMFIAHSTLNPTDTTRIERRRMQSSKQCYRSGTYQQFNFLIDARSDCLDRATTISSVSRVMVL